MTDILRLPDDLARALKTARQSARMSKSTLAQRAGKVREVVYRLESGQDVTVSSLMAVLSALGLAMRIEKAGMPSMQDVAARFAQDDDDAP